MTLREQIAERLYCAYYSTRPRPPLQTDLSMAAHKTFDPADPGDAAWLAVADECIRQMEWARREGAEWETEARNGTLDLPPFQLTAAPEDWKP